MPKVDDIEYEVVCANDHIEALEVQVTSALEGGWIPQGGVCVSQDAKGNRSYYQAMIRDEKGRIRARKARVP